MEDSDLSGEIVKLICREGFGKGRLDQFMEVCGCFQSRHCEDVRIGEGCSNDDDSCVDTK